MSHSHHSSRFHHHHHASKAKAHKHHKPDDTSYKAGKSRHSDRTHYSRPDPRYQSRPSSTRAIALAMSAAEEAKDNTPAWARELVEKVKQSELFKLSKTLLKMEQDAILDEANLTQGTAKQDLDISEKYYQKLEAQRDISDMIGEQFNKLGNVSLNRDHYFEESKNSHNCATEFLSTFLKNPSNRHLIQSFYDTTHNSPLISFVTATLCGQKCCLVAMNISGKKGYYDIFKCIRNFTQEYKSGLGYKFIFIRSCDPVGEYNANYFAMLHIYKTINSLLGLSQEYDRLKFCAEKVFFLSFLQLYAKYGTAFNIDGVVNCYLDLRQHNPSFSTYTHFLNLNNGMTIPMLPCCDCCIQDKQVTLLSLATAQAHAYHNADGAFPLCPGIPEQLRQFEESIDPLPSLSTVVVPVCASAPTARLGLLAAPSPTASAVAATAVVTRTDDNNQLVSMVM